MVALILMQSGITVQNISSIQQLLLCTKYYGNYRGDRGGTSKEQCKVKHSP